MYVSIRTKWKRKKRKRKGRGQAKERRGKKRKTQKNSLSPILHPSKPPAPLPTLPHTPFRRHRRTRKAIIRQCSPTTQPRVSQTFLLHKFPNRGFHARRNVCGIIVQRKGIGATADFVADARAAFVAGGVGDAGGGRGEEVGAGEGVAAVAFGAVSIYREGFVSI